MRLIFARFTNRAYEGDGLHPLMRLLAGRVPDKRTEVSDVCLPKDSLLGFAR
jgi:hypothetical protein